MDELKPCPKEAEALDIIESMLDVADMKCTGPLYANDPPRSGICRIPEEDAAILRRYIVARRAEPENKPLTLEQLRQMDGEPVKVVEDGEYEYGLVSLSGHFLAPKEEAITLCSGNFYLLREMAGNFEVYPVAYARKPEREEK